MNNHPDPSPVELPVSAAPAARRTCGLARVSFWLAMLSILCGAALLLWAVPAMFPTALLRCLWLAWLATAVSAAATGVLARNRLKADPSLSGQGWAWAGTILGSMICVIVFVHVFLLVYVSFAMNSPTSRKNGCISNLRQIDGAKEQWALDNKKTATDTATWNDLIGPDKYIKLQPICPAGGKFTLNDMTTKPQCTISNHALQ